MPCVSEGLRLLRAGVFAGVCVALSVGGHVSASGGGVPVPAVFGAAVAALVFAWLGARRECSAPGLVAAMGAWQLGLHAWFSWAAERAYASAPAAHGHEAAAAHRHGQTHGVLELPDGTGMLAAHAGVAAVAALWLRVGEAAVFRLLARWDARVRAGVRVLLGPRPAPGPTPPRVRPTTEVVGALRELRIRYDVARRGPPATASSSR